MLLEPEICRLAAVNATTADIKKMKDLVRRYRRMKNADAKDPYSYTLFHRLVGRSCGNPLYAVVNESIMDFTEGFIRTIKPVSKFIHKDQDHDEILDALEKRDPQRAAEMGTRHAEKILMKMRKLEQTYLKLIRDEERPVDHALSSASR
jgi:DNA-binding FadR family transcriptional regulator